MKYQREAIHKLQVVNVLGEPYISREAVMKILNLRCGDCVHYSKGNDKNYYGKCTNPVNAHVDGWRWCQPSSAVCRKFKALTEEQG